MQFSDFRFDVARPYRDRLKNIFSSLPVDPDMESERTPLLAENGDNHSNSPWERFQKQLMQSQIRVYADETLLLLQNSLPVILAYALQNSLQACSLLIVGRSSPENLATAAFSYMFATCTGWLIGAGGTTALDTLASSAFTGSSNEHYLGVLLQRAFLVLGLMYIPITILWAYSEPLFLALGQDPLLAKNTARFLTCLIPGGWGYIYFEAMKKFLQAQGTWRSGGRTPNIFMSTNAVLHRVDATWDIRFAYSGSDQRDLKPFILQCLANGAAGRTSRN